MSTVFKNKEIEDCWFRKGEVAAFIILDKYLTVVLKSGVVLEFDRNKVLEANLRDSFKYNK